MSDVTGLAGLTERASALLGAGFVRNVATLAGGQTLAVIIPILTAPILGRLYTPAEYGVLAAYMSVAVVITTIGNWQYAQAIVFEADDEAALSLVRVCLWTTLVTTAGALVVVLALQWLPLAPTGGPVVKWR